MKVTDPEVVNLQHLHWILKVCQENPEEWGGYLFQLETKFHQMVDDVNLENAGTPSRAFMFPARAYVGKVTVDQAVTILTRAKALFTGLADGKLTEVSAETGKPVHFYLAASTPESRFFQGVVLHSDPVAQVLVALQQHFVRSGLTGERVRRCAGCPTIFIRDRKPQKGKEQFCSTTCARRAAKRAWSERQQESFIKSEAKLVSADSRPGKGRAAESKPARTAKTKIRKPRK